MLGKANAERGANRDRRVVPARMRAPSRADL
jgi:hypothetical protein